MSVSPFNHPFLSGLLGDVEMSTCFSAESDIREILRFEAALASVQGQAGVIPLESAQAIAAACTVFEPDMAALNRATARDGVAVPELMRQLRSTVRAESVAFVHFGATSQDAIDTSLTLRMLIAFDLIEKRIADVVNALDAIQDRDSHLLVMAHTRMQAAILVPASRKISSWRDPLVRNAYRLAKARNDIAVLTFGGAAGTLDVLAEKGADVGRRLAELLGLTYLPARHSERDGLATVASVLSAICGGLGKMGADIALAAQTEVAEIVLLSGGGSSAMPHKVNPVGAEILVALARFNATLLSGMHGALIHENERSGAAWTLEWLLLPQIFVATAASLRTAESLLATVKIRGEFGK